MNKLSILTLAITLTGCFTVGPDYEKPQIEAPKQWRFAAEDAKDTANLPWWEQLQDPVLNNLVEQALLNNLDLKIAIANVEQFMGLYGSTRANLFPQIYGSADYAHQQPSSRQINLPGIQIGKLRETDFAQLAASLNWELDVWGALRRANEAARADLYGQEAFKHGVILSLVSSVAQTYITLRELDRNLEITQDIVNNLGEELRIARARFNEGYSSELEVEQVDSEYQRRSALIPVYEQNIAQTEHALSVLLGRNPGPIQRGLSLDELKLPAVPAGLPSDVLARRPDIQQAEQTLIAANARIGVARGLYFPRISLTGDVGQVSTQVASLFAPGANFWSVGASLLTPIFTAGKIAGEVQAAEAVQRAALANYQSAIISGFREFEDALVSSQKTLVQMEKQGKRVAAVENYYRLSHVRYDEGYTDYITVLDALRQLYDAQVELVQAQSATFVASIGLYRAMGGGWIVAAEQKAQMPEPEDAAFFP